MIKIKKIPFFILFFFCVLLSGQQQEESKILNTNANTLTWESIGPGGGHVMSLMFNQNNEDEIFAWIMEKGGIFKTVNAGQTWEITASTWWVGANGFAIDPKNTNNMYSLYFYGIKKSEDGSLSWEGYDFPENYWGDVNNREIDVAIDPQNSNNLYVAAYHKKDFYSDEPSSMALLKSTDGGRNWEGKIINDRSQEGHVYCIAIDPTDSNIIYAEGYFSDGSTPHYKVYKSTDGGSIWADITGDFFEDIAPNTSHKNSAIVIDPKNPLRIYIGTAKGIWRSIDGGQTWAKNLGEAYAHKLAIDPSNPDIIYAGYDNNIYKSTDGGVNWVSYYQGLKGCCTGLLARSSHVQSAYENSTLLYYGSDFGVYKSIDGGLSWLESQTGMNATLNYAVAYGSSSSTAVQASSNDSMYTSVLGDALFKSTDFGSSWARIPDIYLDENIHRIFVNPHNFNDIYILIARTCVGAYLHRSIDGGASWQQVHIDLAWDLDVSFGATSNSVHSIYLAGWEPNGPPYGIALHKSTDGGLNWITHQISSQDGVGRAVVIDPNNNDIIYVVGRYADTSIIGWKNALFKSSDGGFSWTEVEVHKDFNPVDGLPQIHDMVIYPSSGNNIYIVTGSGLFMTKNSGLTWEILARGLGARCLHIQSYNNTADGHLGNTSLNSMTELILGGQIGIYRSIDGGNTWTEMNTGLTIYPWRSEFQYASVVSLDVSTDGTVLFAGTEGSGAFKMIREEGPSFPTKISLSSKQINFGSTTSGDKTSDQQLRISNSGFGTLNWSITDDMAWLSCSPSSGIDTGVVTVSVDPTGRASGTHSGIITVSDSNASNSPQTVAVTLTVKETGTSKPPIGFFASPEGGDTVSSSVPVTGWVVDDIGVESVKIYRDPVGAEGGGAVYIGDADFVEGARPDIELFYPEYPQNYQAGWGYMMLTNFLPNSGNGTFVLYALATDVEGNQTLLTTKTQQPSVTITCDNINTVKPFGAMETPTQGGPASGSSFWNWGWVLTPQPNQIPTDGSTIEVFVNGVKLGNPVYNNFRQDVYDLFPDYENSSGAFGYFIFDTTTYTNAVHSIYWVATDDGGNTDGIGSRYFTIQNAGGSAAAMGNITNHALSERSLSYDDTANMPIAWEPIKVKKGFRKDKKASLIESDPYGVYQVEVREVERIEIDLGNEVTSGYMLVGNQLRTLPIGSTLDTEKGKFYWLPGPGFIGEYDLVFIKTDEFGMQLKISVTIRIRPKFGTEREDFSRSQKQYKNKRIK